MQATLTMTHTDRSTFHTSDTLGAWVTLALALAAGHHGQTEAHYKYS
jgi:hypothetical protein